ncbi:uncharacterized protein LOC6651659 isoform X2 [Drosophila willistoni]|uniref:uncharacterized protein LOC6651659 isoform X2 n=1 Tax=Drosophila willistoni TaxID=7260 RepID=UPI001F0853F9|nr:uncharacterized protein LOC6651659 isoform X2 [Drosophila willistoni]
MAPALTAEPLSPKEKLTSTASPAARNDSSGSAIGDSASSTRKPSTPTPATATTRVTRSKSASSTSIAQANNNNSKRKTANNNRTSSNDPMGLSTAPIHATTTTATPQPAASSNTDVVASTSQDHSPPTEQNNNDNKDNSTAQLLADLTSDFEEAISAEICLRKTLPEVSLSKEPTPSATGGTITSDAVADVVVSTSSGSGITPPMLGLSTSISDVSTPPQSFEEKLLKQDDSFEKRLSLLDGSSSADKIVEAPGPSGSVHSTATVQPTTPSKQQQTATVAAAPILASPQGRLHLTPQSTSSSINFLKDGATAGVLEDPDIEEVLKALKTLDGGHVNTDAICDFNFFSEEWEDPGVAPSAGPSVPSQIPASIEPVDSKPSCSSNSLRTQSWEESHKELLKTQSSISRQIDFLLRRMGKFQARQMCRHISEEVAGVFEWSARSSHKAPNPVRSCKLNDQEATVQSIVSGRPSSNFWEEQKKNPLPATQMSNVHRHIGTAARHQQICHSTSCSSATLSSSSTWYNSSNTATVPAKRPRKNQQNQDATTGLVITGTEQSTIPAAPRADDIVPSFDTYVTNELTHVSGLLHTEMREVQNAIDSDATESSSGGESADEMVTYNNPHQQSLPITRRAVWRYSRDRAAIALRWSWLYAQLADLDMKIRQHSDLYIDLNQNKGEVQLAPTPITQKNQTSPAANGYKEDAAASGSDWLCSRARPLVLSEFRKRKLFQTTNMHTISKKAARPSNIKCGCQWPQVPCTLCTGRTDPTAPRELVETMMPQNRVALVDAGYHPVLSFSDDICQSVHLEAIARQPDWQYRVMRCQPKAIVKSMWKAEREMLARIGGGGNSGANRRPGETGKRRYVRRKERNNNSNKDTTASSSSAAAATTAGGVGGGGAVDSGNGTALGKKQRHHPNVLSASDTRQRHHYNSNHQQQQPYSVISNSGNGAKKQRKSASSSNSTQNPNNNNNSQQQNGDNKCIGEQWDQSRNRRHSSPSHVHRNERSSERRVRPVYDIDNIVIPYSIAAQTRVEILPYKEIPTPKWRIVDSENNDVKQSPQQESEAPNESAPENTMLNGNSKIEEKMEKPLPKVNGMRRKNSLPEPVPEVKHNNNNNNNNNNKLVNGNAKKEKGKTKEDIRCTTKNAGKMTINGVVGSAKAEIKLTNNKVETAKQKTLETTSVKEEKESESLSKRPKLELNKSKAAVSEQRSEHQVQEKNGQKDNDHKKDEEKEAQNDDEDDEEEDTSDEAYIVRHDHALMEERRRFETYLKFPWNSRSRANRRTDSRAESSGANTPDPASPAPNFVSGSGAPGDESIPSPLAQPMGGHPLDGFNESTDMMNNIARKPRRRTTSSKLREQQDRRSATPDTREPQPPSRFAPLHFPLSEEVYQRMLAETYAEPKRVTHFKRAKSKSVSSNCDGSSTAGGSSRRSSKAKSAPMVSKITQSQMVNGNDAQHQTADANGINEEDDGIDYEPEDDIMLEEEDDDDYPKHHLAPFDEPLPLDQDVYIDAYLSDQDALEKDLGLADDPFMEDDPNDPEWKGSPLDRRERVRKRF